MDDQTKTPETYRYPRTLKEAFGRYTNTRIETPPEREQRKQRMAELVDNVALVALVIANIAIAVGIIDALISGQ